MPSIDKKKKKVEEKRVLCGMSDAEEIFALSLLCLQHGLTVIKMEHGYEIFQVRR